MFLSSVQQLLRPLCVSRLFCQKCCLPGFPSNWADRLIPALLDWPPGWPGTSAAPSMWWRVWHTQGGWWRRFEIHLKNKIWVKMLQKWGQTLSWQPVLTEGDETRIVSIDLLEKLGHVYVWHAQSRTQQGCKLLSGDAFIPVCVKELRKKGKTSSCTRLRKGHNKIALIPLSPTGKKKPLSLISLKHQSMFCFLFSKPHLTSRHNRHSVKIRWVCECCLCSAALCCSSVSENFRFTEILY